MSSTNRSNARDTHIADYYVTPVDKIKEFLDEFIKCEPNAFNGYVLDPCCGGDSNHEMSYPKALESIGVNSDNIVTVDIRKNSKAEIREDYLTIDCPGDFQTIITNPPFNIAREIIEKSLNDVKNNGFVIMLLRLNFFGGNLRKDMWDKQLPKYAFVHHRRMSFTDNGKTDSIEYMHCVWQKGYYPEFTQLKII
jgi:hypothetical protein